jgi:hypothetical protein
LLCFSQEAKAAAEYETFNPRRLERKKSKTTSCIKFKNGCKQQ